MLVLYLPWLFVLFRQMAAIDGDYWISPITEASLHTYPEMLFGAPSEWCRELLIVFYLIGFFRFLIKYTADQRNIWSMGCYGVAAFWFALGIGYSVARTTILNSRYLVVLLPLLWIPVLLSCAESAYKYVRPAAYILLTLCFVQNYEELYEEYADSYWCELRDYIAANASEEDVFFHFYIQDLSVCEAFFPEREQYILDGADSGEAFHYWPELTGCGILDSAQELADCPSNIWCLNGSWLAQFEDMGFLIETIPLGSQELYRIYRPD